MAVGMNTRAEKSSTTASTTVTRSARQPFVARAGSGTFLCAGTRAAPAGVQTKMTVNKPGDKFEQESEQMADKVMRMPTPPAAAKDEKLQRQPEEKLQKREEEQILKAAQPEEKLQRAAAAEEKPPRRDEEKILKADQPNEKLQKADDNRLQKAAAPEEKLQRREEEKILRAEQSIDKIQKASDDKLQRAATDEKLQAQGSEGGSSAAVSGDVQSAIRNKTTGGEPLPAEVRDHMEPRFNADFGSVRVHKDSESAA